MFESVINTSLSEAIDVKSFIVCSMVSLTLGILIALTVSVKRRNSKSFLLTLVIMPLIVQMVIMLVNGNLGTGIAVMGAFSLVRFRSVPGKAEEITGIFLSMAAGLATAMGYIWIAIIFTLAVSMVILIFAFITFPNERKNMRELRITVPENLNYIEVFDEIFNKYTRSQSLLMAKTTNLGSLYKLQYQIELKDEKEQKKFIDDIRVRNGNLEVAIGFFNENRDEL